MISHLVQGSLRNSRRNGLDIVDAYQVADEALACLYPDQRFATAVFGRLEPDSGRFRWIAAGHPPPLLVRSGRVVGEAPAVPALPIGLRGGTPPVNEVVLEPGDALLLYTDGVTEGGARGGERFGLDRLVDMLGRTLLSGMPPAELLRRLVIAVLEHAAHELHDDMTVVLVQRRTGDVLSRPPAAAIGRRVAGSSGVPTATTRRTRWAASAARAALAPQAPWTPPPGWAEADAR